MVNRGAKFMNFRVLAIRNVVFVVGVYRCDYDDNKEIVGNKESTLDASR